MNPSPPAIAAIQTFVAGQGGFGALTDDQVVAAANNATIANPSPQGTVPAGYSFTQLLGLLPQSSAANVESFPALANLFADISSQNSPSVLAAVALMAASGRIASGEATALVTAINATQPDPSWPSHIGWAQATLGRPLDADDSATARRS